MTAADKASRKQRNRAAAEALRAAGILPTGTAWNLAREGVTDTARLLAANIADGDTARKRGADILPAGVRPGDYLPEYGAACDASALDRVAGVWCLSLTDGRDVDVHPLTAVTVARTRQAPAWVQAAASEYRDARDVWEARRESGQTAPSTVPGSNGASVACYQLEDADYAAAFPRPRYADFVREHAARLRAGAA